MSAKRSVLAQQLLAPRVTGIVDKVRAGQAGRAIVREAKEMPRPGRSSWRSRRASAALFAAR